MLIRVILNTVQIWKITETTFKFCATSLVIVTQMGLSCIRLRHHPDRGHCKINHIYVTRTRCRASIFNTRLFVSIYRHKSFLFITKRQQSLQVRSRDETVKVDAPQNIFYYNNTHIGDKKLYANKRVFTIINDKH